MSRASKFLEENEPEAATVEQKNIIVVLKDGSEQSFQVDKSMSIEDAEKMAKEKFPDAVSVRIQEEDIQPEEEEPEQEIEVEAEEDNGEDDNELEVTAKGLIITIKLLDDEQPEEIEDDEIEANDAEMEKEDDTEGEDQDLDGKLDQEEFENDINSRYDLDDDDNK